MGIGAIGRTVYIGAFGGTGGPNSPGVYSMTASGRKLTQVVHTPAPNIALGTRGQWVYFGDLTGRVYRIRL
jgi:hypothetical protein